MSNTLPNDPLNPTRSTYDPNTREEVNREQVAPVKSRSGGTGALIAAVVLVLAVIGFALYSGSDDATAPEATTPPAASQMEQAPATPAEPAAPAAPATPDTGGATNDSAPAPAPAPAPAQ
ncbi:hypothetical protein [Limoniibacter endophyticus]|uniref:Uncharacterized protein n=1 Tax=Limoniibacter endophyticus TaxID=1565040 RepID=A0A8J3DT63_9HYPH|nr:hypothetical protein [Limoniibacter endophyticus]GHC74165.1 hypothetical protein GCM10010136_23080 [Limoniibacter endophyticus]